MDTPVFIRLGQVCLALLVVCSTLSECSTYPPPTLRHVNMVYRHGDRSPVFIYPTDQHQLDAWPDGLGWLSNIGKEQQYKLGQYLRERYGGFINITRYNHEELKVEASAVQRCLMSAYSNLAGFFPPQGDQVWNEKLLWQAIPVTSVPEKEDNKLAIQASCPRYDQLLAECFNSEEVKKYQEENKEFLQYVSDSTGVPNESLSTLWGVGDTLVCEQAHNMTWNAWAYKNGTFEQLQQLTVYGWDLLYAKPEMARLRGGPLLKEMIENMRVVTKNSSALPRIHMYSAHDSTVAALMHAMNLFNQQQPPYRTVVMVELHKIGKDDVVKVFYRNDTTREPYYFPIEGCDDPCEFSKFEMLMSPRIPQDWIEECKVVSGGSKALSLASIIALGIGCILVVVIIGSLVVLTRRQHGHYDKL